MSSLTEPVVRIRGLPFSAREEEIVEFFSNVRLKGGKNAVNFTFGRDGRATGEAFVVCESIEDAEKALTYHNKHMGKRYLEVFPSNFEEMSFMTGRSSTAEDYVLRLRGLPYDVDKAEIIAFFDGLEIAPNGIGLLLDNMGRSTGEAFVQFTSQEMLDKARAKHMQKIGHRYIELFKSNMVEANSAISRQIAINEGNLDYDQGYDGGRGFRGGGGGGGRPSPYQRPSGPGGYYGGGGGGGPMRGNVKSFTGGGGPSRYGMGRDGGGGDGGPAATGGGTGEEWNSTTGHSVHMRGLPFNVTDADIYTFFSPLIPAHVEIHVNPTTGRLTGEADVDFASHEETKEAMKKDRERIGQRYIELFLNSGAQTATKTQRDAALAAIKASMTGGSVQYPGDDANGGQSAAVYAARGMGGPGYPRAPMYPPSRLPPGPGYGMDPYAGYSAYYGPQSNYYDAPAGAGGYEGSANHSAYYNGPPPRGYAPGRRYY